MWLNFQPTTNKSSALKRWPFGSTLFKIKINLAKSQKKIYTNRVGLVTRHLTTGDSKCIQIPI